MMTQMGTAGRVRIAIVAISSVMALSVGRASAQPEPAVECTTYPSESPWQTIVVHLVENDCRIDLTTDIPRLRTFVGERAFWDVCNKCGAPVDVKIFDSAPNSLSSLFSRFAPMIDASNTSTERDIPPGQDGYFEGDVDNAAPLGGNKYAVAVKFSTEGEGGWDEFDPELQIDENRSARRALPLVGGSLLGVLAGFLLGWWLGRRRATT